MNDTKFAKFFTASLFTTLLMLLTACGGGGNSDSTTPFESGDASGLYQGTGSVNSLSNNLLDLKGMVQNNRFILFDAGENLLYDGQIQSITGQNISATVDVYKDGVNVSQSIATGTVTAGNTIAVSLNGNGYGEGTLSLTYDPLSEVPATLNHLKAERNWSGPIHSVSTLNVGGEIRPDIANSTFTGGTSNFPTVECSYNSGVIEILDSSVNVYSLSFFVNDELLSSTCDHTGDGYTGFLMVNDAVIVEERRMWFAATNGTNSTFSVMGDVWL